MVRALMPCRIQASPGAAWRVVLSPLHLTLTVAVIRGMRRIFSVESDVAVTRYPRPSASLKVRWISSRGISPLTSVVDMCPPPLFCWAGGPRLLLLPSEEAHGQDDEGHRPDGQDQ